MNDEEPSDSLSSNCKHCLLSIPVGARICAHCGHKQSAFSRVGIHFGFIGLLASFAALGVAYWQAAISQETLNEAKLETIRAEYAAERAEEALSRIEVVAAESKATDEKLIEVIDILISE